MSKHGKRIISKCRYRRGDDFVEFNKVQLSAWELIQADARFLYTLVDIQQNAKNISSNYIVSAL